MRTLKNVPKWRWLLLASALVSTGLLVFWLVGDHGEAMAPVDPRDLDSVTSPPPPMMSEATENVGAIPIAAAAKGTRAVPTASNDLAKFTEQIREGGLAIGQTDSNPQRTRQQLASLAENLTADQLRTLNRMATDEREATDSRFLAVFLLGHSGAAESSSYLKDIVESKLTESKNERRNSDEIIIHTYALELLEQKLSPADFKAYLRGFLAVTPNGSLARHAQFLLSKKS